MSVSVKDRKARSCDLKPYCYHSDDAGFAEVTEWSNGEGVDILLQSKNDTRFLSLTYGEWQCLQVLMNYQEKEDE